MGTEQNKKQFSLPKVVLDPQARKYDRKDLFKEIRRFVFLLLMLFGFQRTGAYFKRAIIIIRTQTS